MYSENQVDDTCEEQMQKYEVFRADDNDITYTRNLYNLEDRAISLIRTKKPVDMDFALNEKQLNNSAMEKKLD